MRAIIAAILIALAIGDSCLADQLAQFTVVGNVIPGSLTGTPGDAARGRSIVLNRAVGLCLLCHSGPFPEERFQGNLAPDLKGTGARWSVEQLRMRMVDSRKLNPDTIMPAYYALDGTQQGGAGLRRQAAIDRRTDRRCGGFSCHLARLKRRHDRHIHGQGQTRSDPARGHAWRTGRRNSQQRSDLSRRTRRLNACVRRSAPSSAKHRSARAESISRFRRSSKTAIQCRSPFQSTAR